MAAEDHIDVGALGQRAVLAHVQVGDRDDDLRAALAERLAHLPGRRERLAHLDVRSRAGALHHLGGGEAEDTDPHPGQGQEDLALRPAERTAAAALQHVGREPHERRFAHPLGQHGRAEVELVIAEGGQIQAERVEPGYHVPALQQRGGHRGRDRVAGEGQHGGRVLAADPLDQGGQPGEPAPPALIHGLERVDVVDLEQRDPD